MKHKHTPRRVRRAQRGVSLIFALLTLVALMLATLALVRSVDTGTLLMGNIGFKQDATATSDQAARQAIGWLTLNNASLNTSVAASGYYASTLELADDGTTVQPAVDATGKQTGGQRQLIDWEGNDCAYASEGSFSTCLKPAAEVSAGRNTARYVIFRLCSKPGDFSVDTSIHCAKPMAGGSGAASKKGELNYADSARFGGSSGPYYRIVVRVQGVRNTASFSETIVHF